MKKKLSLLLAATLLSSSLFAMGGAHAAFSDVADNNSYKKAITTLSKLKVINGYQDGTFGPEKDITRAEFTKIIVYMLGYEDLSTKITQFKDVSDDHWANANIKTAYDLGIINGYSETAFGPDNPVTYEQALKMVVCALGYQADADAKGGYPEGYRAEAATLDLQKGISGIEYTSNAPRGVIAQIMYNALEVNLREYNGTKWENTTKTIMNDYLDVYKLKGTVVGVEESTTAACDAKLYPGQFAIDEDPNGTEYVIDYTEYTSSITQMTPYLGQTIQIYYRKDEDDLFLVEIDDETYTNKEVTVSSYDISEYSDRTFKYYPDGGTKVSTIRFDKNDFTVRYNGRAVSGDVTITNKFTDEQETYDIQEALKQWLSPESDNYIYGTVRIIDSKADGTYNVVDIYDYKTIVALSTPISPDYRISDKTLAGNYLILDPESADYKVALTKDGSDISVTSIAAGDVLTYAVDLDGEYYTVYDTNQSVTGTITGLNLNAKQPTILIDNVEYNVSYRFELYFLLKEQKTLEVGNTVTAYMDALGTLEWGTISKSTSYYPYAYVVNAIEEDDNVYLKLFAPTSTSITSLTSSSSYKVKNFKIQYSNPKLNGKKSSPAGIMSALARSAADCNPDAQIASVSGDIKLTGYNQLIKVGFNSAGEVSDVITIDSDFEGIANDETNKLVRYKQMNPNARYYVTSSSIKESSNGATLYSIKSTTPLFVIPKDRTAADSYTIKSAITTNSMETSKSYYLDAYDLSTAKYPSVMLVYASTFKSGTSITYSSAYRLLAEDVKDEYDADAGDIYSMLNTYNSATTVTKTKIASEAGDLFANLRKGDVILNGTDGDKMADSLMVAVKYNDIKAVLNDGKAGKFSPVYKYLPIEDEDGTPQLNASTPPTYVGSERYSWVAPIGDGPIEDWQNANDNWQLYKFDFRYTRNNVSRPTFDYYTTGGNSTEISSRAFMCNIMQILPAENLLYVTQDGFDEYGLLNENNYLEVKVSSSTKIVRYDTDEEEFTPYAKGTESTALTVNDLKDAENYGDGCSKVLLTYVSGSTSHSSTAPTAKFIVIYSE